MNLKQGSLLQGGKYKIKRELGHGGFGITYLATQVGLNRKVAIKEFFMSEYCERDADTSQVSLGTSGSRDTVERFKKKFIKEAQNIACLKHPHIISIHDVFEDNGTAYYVMEYLEYGSLADLVKRQGRLSEADALRYIRQIADALCYIHARKMNHLDVKPGNILIDETDHAVLIDFGLSKRYDDEGNQTSTTPVGISHGYAPLEQYKKSGVDTFSPATDIYSLGATLYKLVTGTTPPDANDVSEDGLPALPSYVSSTVASAIEQAMQPRRKDRPQSVDAFLALLAAEVKVEDECTVLDEDLRASLVTPSASQRSARPSINRGTVGSASSHPEGKHQQAPPLFIEGVSVGRGSSKRSAEPTPIWKKLLLPALACIVVVLAVVLWPKGGDTPVKTEVVTQQTEILPPAGRQNDTNQQQTVQTQSQQQSQQQSQPAKPIKEEPAAPTTTPLYVTTTPSGVTVYVDGKRVGTTPIEDKEIARGSHKVKLSKEGYEDKTLTRTFGDRPVVLNETLAETPKPQPQVQPQQPSAPVASSSSSSAPATTGKINGHEYVDLGLSVKWAICNVGASSPSDYGNYYAWGETSTKSDYSSSNSKTYEKSMGSIAGNASYDAARANWGGTWRLPTKAEFQELIDKCTWTWTTQGGHNGYKVTGKNGKSIFLPAAGWREVTSLHYAGDYGNYWSASPYESDTRRADNLFFGSGDHRVLWYYRFNGRSVRPVSE